MCKYFYALTERKMEIVENLPSPQMNKHTKAFMCQSLCERTHVNQVLSSSIESQLSRLNSYGIKKKQWKLNLFGALEFESFKKLKS